MAVSVSNIEASARFIESIEDVNDTARFVLNLRVFVTDAVEPGALPVICKAYSNG